MAQPGKARAWSYTVFAVTSKLVGGYPRGSSNLPLGATQFLSYLSGMFGTYQCISTLLLGNLSIIET